MAEIPHRRHTPIPNRILIRSHIPPLRPRRHLPHGTTILMGAVWAHPPTDRMGHETGWQRPPRWDLYPTSKPSNVWSGSKNMKPRGYLQDRKGVEGTRHGADPL